MSDSKRVSISFDPEVYEILKLKTDNSSCTISEVLNKILQNKFQEDLADLKIIFERKHETTISFQKLLNELKMSKKI